MRAMNRSSADHSARRSTRKRVELEAVGGAVGVEPEAFVVGDLGDAEDLAQARNWRSLAAVMITSRSFVGIGWYG